MVSGSLMTAGMRDMHLAVQTQKLERAYQNGLQATIVTQELEERRRLRLRLLLAEAENEDLREQARQRDDAAQVLQSERTDLREQLKAASQSLDKVREEVRIKTRQIDKLQAERDGLRGQNSDSSKILTEKLVLAHEVSILKPEVEHLRSQLATTQSAISEKQALQRQLRAVEVELENEKRATQKARTANERSGSDDKQIQELQKQLEMEVEECQRMRDEARAVTEELEERNATLELRLDAFRTKLAKTKEHLADAQRQLKDTKTNNTTAQVEEFEPEPEPESESEPELEPKPKSKAKPKKRSFAEVELNASLGTPGDLPPPKRGKRAGSVQPGEKSSFSITPFLNRTGSVPPESPTSSPSRPPNNVKQGGNSTATMKIPIAASPKIKANPAPPRPKSFGTASASRANTQPQGKRSAARSLSAPKLDLVPEEEEDENEAGDVQKLGGPPPSQTTTTGKQSEQTLAKKKRIFLGKTLFDDDDDAPARPKPVGVFPNKLSVGNLTKDASAKAANLGTMKPMTTLGGFSPLKKDRKLTAPVERLY